MNTESSISATEVHTDDRSESGFGRFISKLVMAGAVSRGNSKVKQTVWRAVATLDRPTVQTKPLDPLSGEDREQLLERVDSLWKSSNDGNEVPQTELRELRRSIEILYAQLPEFIQDPVNGERSDRVFWTSVSERPSTPDILRLSDDQFEIYKDATNLTSYWIQLNRSAHSD